MAIYYHGTNNPEDIKNNGFILDDEVKEYSPFIGDNIFEGIHLSKSIEPYEENGQMEDCLEVLEVSFDSDKILSITFNEIGALFKKYGINEFDKNASFIITEALIIDGVDAIDIGNEIIVFKPDLINVISK
jgi:hypothetical protein